MDKDKVRRNLLKNQVQHHHQHHHQHQQINIPVHQQSVNSKNMHDPDPAASDKQKMFNKKISDECDQLLKELEMDMKTMNKLNSNLVKNIKHNNSNNSLQSTQSTTTPNTSIKKLTNYSKQVFYINKVKMVELNDVKVTNESNQNKFLTNPQHNNNNNNNSTQSNNIINNSDVAKTNNQEYFDSLIKLIENAAKNLTE